MVVGAVMVNKTSFCLRELVLTFKKLSAPTRLIPIGFLAILDNAQ